VLADAATPLQWLSDPRLLAALVLSAVWAATRQGVLALLAGSASYLVLLAWA
jgi:branched-subunit amino acid transport protein